MGEPEQTTTETSNLSPPDARAFLIVPRAKFRLVYAAAAEWLWRQSACCDLQVRARSLELIKIKNGQMEKCEGSRCARPQFNRPDRNGAACDYQGAYLSRLSINLGLVGLRVCRRRG